MYATVMWIQDRWILVIGSLMVAAEGDRCPDLSLLHPYWTRETLEDAALKINIAIASSGESAYMVAAVHPTYAIYIPTHENGCRYCNHPFDDGHHLSKTDTSGDLRYLITCERTQTLGLVPRT